jgi:hypothetical protein
MPDVSISMPIVNKVRRNPRVLAPLEYYREGSCNSRSYDIIDMRAHIFSAIGPILCGTIAVPSFKRSRDPNRRSVVGRNSAAHVAMTPNHPGYSLQSYFAKIQFPGEWKMTTGSVSFDSGVARTPHDLASNIKNDSHSPERNYV